MIKARELVNKNQLPKKEEGLYCLIGQAENGAVHFCDITAAPHILVGGCTGTGKSVFLRGVILSLIMNYTPDEVGLILLDMKHHAEFVVYDDIPHVLGAELEVADKELDSRLSSMNAYDKEKRIVVIIDEYAELSRNEQDKKIVGKLVQCGHGVGIHVIMATQRVAKDVITASIKECFSTVVSCAVAEKRDSKFVLGKCGAEKLRGKGDMLYKDRGENITRVQTGYVGNSDVQDIVQALKEKYKKAGQI
ncbi:MAG: DNA translocase FtsK [Clostridia bacterium]|nr:DNA translocase FtsK [Clostridia bacterium]